MIIRSCGTGDSCLEGEGEDCSDLFVASLFRSMRLEDVNSLPLTGSVSTSSTSL